MFWKLYSTVLWFWFRFQGNFMRILNSINHATTHHMPPSQMELMIPATDVKNSLKTKVHPDSSPLEYWECYRKCYWNFRSQPHICLARSVNEIILTLDVRGPSYLGLTRSISWLLMPWLLPSPEHQQPWYWLCRICKSWSYLIKDFKYLCHINVE